MRYARDNVQVNALAPGWFVTDMNAEAFGDPKIRERLLRDMPMHRTGRAEEIGPLLVYLASPASDFMTGQTVFLDGGLGGLRRRCGGLAREQGGERSRGAV